MYKINIIFLNYSNENKLIKSTLFRVDIKDVSKCNGEEGRITEV